MLQVMWFEKPRGLNLPESAESMRALKKVVGGKWRRDETDKGVAHYVVTLEKGVAECAVAKGEQP